MKAWVGHENHGETVNERGRLSSWLARVKKEQKGDKLGWLELGEEDKSKLSWKGRDEEAGCGGGTTMREIERVG